MISASITHPNDPSLNDDFARAIERPLVGTSSSFLKKSIRNTTTAPSPKSVRFSDANQIQTVNVANNNSTGDDDTANRNALFPYRDDPASTLPDQDHLDNQQIHAYHSQVLAEQDEQLDRLGESIGRQRELSIQIGDELDSQVELLDDIDGHVVRHQSRLDQARKGLGTVARKANDNKQLTTIFVLIIILVLLIIILK